MKPTHEQITQRAYEIYLQRGCPEGKDLENWLEAERQLSAETESGAKDIPAVAEGSRPRASRSTPSVGARKTSTRQTARV